VSRFQFGADHSTTFEVKRLCELVEIERSSYYAWQAAAPAREARAAADAALAERIRAVHEEDKPVVLLGSPPSSTTARLPGSGSTTSGSLG
jgi:hypothetical protein